MAELDKSRRTRYARYLRRYQRYGQVGQTHLAKVRTAPVISVAGNAAPTVGVTLNRANAVWNQTPDSVTTQWYNGASAINGQTGASLSTTGLAATNSITARQTGVFGGRQVVATSNAIVLTAP